MTLFRRLAGQSGAVAGSAALAAFTLILCSAVLRPVWRGTLYIEGRLAIAHALPDSPWGGAWDGLAQAPGSAQSDALRSLTDAVVYLGLGAVFIALFSIVLHTIGRVLAEWAGLTVRCALGARWADLWRHAGGSLLRDAARGLLAGALVGGGALAALRAFWPALLTRPPLLLPAAAAAGVAALLVVSAVVVSAAPLLALLQRRVRAVSDLQGDHVTARGPLLFAQSSLATLQLAGLLVVAYGGALIVKGSSLLNPDLPLPFADTSVVTPLAAPDSLGLAARADRYARMAAEAQRGDTPLVALATPGAWQGYGKRATAIQACMCVIQMRFIPYKLTPMTVAAVSPGAMELMRVHRIAGRPLTAADTLGGEPVIVLSTVAAARLGVSFAGALRLQLGFSPAAAGTYRVVGVVEAPEVPGLGGGGAQPMAYVSLLQHPASAVELTARRGAAEVLAAAGWSDRHLAGFTAGPPAGMGARIRAAEAPIAWFGALVLSLTVGALLVAGYALLLVMAQSVTLRKREIATRLALGAQPWHIVRWVGARSFVLATVGSAVGVSGALQVGIALRRQVRVSGSADVATLLLLIAAFGALAVLASLGPARRAVAIEPAAAWRDTAR